MGYCSACDIYAVCPHLFKPASVVDSSTCPTLTQVNSWISTGSLIIDAKLATLGYDPIGESVAAYGLAQDANINYAAYRAELSLLSARVNRDENTRDMKFRQAFKDGLAMFEKLDLTTMGVSRSNRVSPYAGGISVDDKDENNDDTDIVQSRFKRDQFINTESLTPLSSAS